MTMPGLPLTEILDLNDRCPDDEITLDEYKLRLQSLKSQNRDLIKIKQDLLIMNKKNDNISKCLLLIKKDYELYKSDLKKTLFYQKVRADKEKILSGKTIYNYTKKREGYRMSSTATELDELIKKNNSLFEQYTKLSNLLESTKKQYDGVLNSSIKNFRKKVCEFCEVVLRLNALND